VNGEPMSQILGFCWMLLRNYQGVVVDASKGQSFEQGLLAWLKEKLGGYSDISLNEGFKSDSISNGKVILGLLNEFDSSMVNYGGYNTTDKLKNCTDGLKIGEEKANVPALMEAAELAAGKVSEKNLVLYYSLWFNAFKDRDAGVSKESLIKRIKELEERVRELTAENESLRENKLKLEVTVEELTSKLAALQDAHNKLLSTHEETVRELSQLKSTYLTEKKNLEARVSELSENIAQLKSNSGDTVTQLQNAKDEITRERDALREELKNVRDQLTREKKELEAKNAELQASLNKARKMREELEEIMKRQQENHSKSIHALRKHLLQHVHDMHVWKVFLEQDREYESEDLHIVMESELEGMEFAEQVQTLDTAITEENERLEKLLKEREAEAAEVVAVNIGKKKHRIKKGLEADHAAQKQADADAPKIGSRAAAPAPAKEAPAKKK
jgi:DNA repair exonuclease SbcCD ATPase subunit